MAVVDRTAPNYYYPARWADMDKDDLDFGSNSPVYIRVPGTPKSGYVVAPAKDGHVYFLDATNLGGKNGHIADLVVATEGASIYTTTASYTTAKGVYVLVSTSGARCPAGVQPARSYWRSQCRSRTVRSRQRSPGARHNRAQRHRPLPRRRMADRTRSSGTPARER